jgi:polysaccharide export outer membrane protein
VVVACAPGHGLPELPSVAPGAYRLGAGDVVRLITVGDDTLTGEFRVGDSGKIALPLLGAERAAGLTPDGLAAEISAALVEADLYTAPSVSVEVTTYRPIFVLGEVSKPGQYPYQPGMTMVTAAAVAGGFTYRAIDGYASVVRIQDGVAVEGKATRQTFIQPGDVITIFERRF